MVPFLMCEMEFKRTPKLRPFSRSSKKTTTTTTPQLIADYTTTNGETKERIEMLGLFEIPYHIIQKNIRKFSSKEEWIQITWLDGVVRISTFDKKPEGNTPFKEVWNVNIKEADGSFTEGQSITRLISDDEKSPGFTISLTFKVMKEFTTTIIVNKEVKHVTKKSVNPETGRLNKEWYGHTNLQLYYGDAVDYLI